MCFPFPRNCDSVKVANFIKNMEIFLIIFVMSYVYQLAVAGAHPSYVVIESHGRLILQQWCHIQWQVHNPVHLFYIFVVQNVRCGKLIAVFRNTSF